MTEDRSLAAIVFSDIVGFTQLMNKDEQAAMALLEKQRRLFRPIIENFGGEWLKEIGDGLLFSFPSAVKAVTCTLEIQRILEHDSKLNVRIGIHIGDVIKKDGDVFGDGVNIASRIEPLSKPGGICISDRVYDDVRNKRNINVEYEGEKKLKGLDYSIKVYSIITDIKSSPDAIVDIPIKKEKKSGLLAGMILSIIIAVSLFFLLKSERSNQAPVISKQSIAVLPFDNMGIDVNSDYFSDGITDDIITYLSKIEGLKVISRTSIMRYKNSDLNLKDIAKELGVTNILEGSVRRDGEKVRISGQLIDAETDEHLWAEMYDRDLKDIFSVQMEVAKNIATVLETKLTDKDVDRLNKTMTTNLEAYELLLMAKELRLFIREEVIKKIELLEKAVMLDPNSSYIYSQLCRIHSFLYFYGIDRTPERQEKAKKAINRAKDIDPISSEVYLANGYYYYWIFLDYDNALNKFNMARSLDPNNSDVIGGLAFVKRRMGHFQEGFDLLKISFDNDPKNLLYATQLTITGLVLGLNDEFDKYYNIAKNLGMDKGTGLYYKVLGKFIPNGNINEFKKIIDEAQKTEHATWFYIYYAEYYSFIGEFDLALQYIDRIKIEDGLRFTEYSSKVFHKAIINRMMGNYEISDNQFKEALIDVDQLVRKQPYDQRFHANRGLINAYLQNKDEAIKDGKTAVKILSIENEKLDGVNTNFNLAKIYSIIGEFDLAIEELKKINDVQPKANRIGYLKFDPAFYSIQEYPQYINLINNFINHQNTN